MLTCVGTRCRPIATCGRLLTRTFTSSYPKPYVVPKGIAGENRAARLELAAAYRGLDLLGLNEGVSNHLSVIAPRQNGDGEVMLVFREGLHWKEVTASNLLGLDMSGKTVEGEGSPDITASCIHLAVHQKRPDTKVIMHTHQPYISALAALEDCELRLVHQNSIRFWNRVAYDVNYGGVAFSFEEGERLAGLLGDKDVLIMGNHGVMVVAPTISMAFEMLYFLERAAMVQVKAMSTQRRIREISEEVCKFVAPEYMKRAQNYADTLYYSIYRELQRTQPDFEK
ncbi:putative aldolase class 2 protein CC_1201 [Penaeus japonicus]|uniref:putative aldolase class 2 protein CC_1201 n=1 Tax=Penaeus japonicus TaxID=27405 RepID=UPI001C717B30|nr:putative aldolase class 2 protein CC_1201 [Penaeus japonicus]